MRQLRLLRVFVRVCVLALAGGRWPHGVATPPLDAAERRAECCTFLLWHAPSPWRRRLSERERLVCIYARRIARRRMSASGDVAKAQRQREARTAEHVNRW